MEPDYLEGAVILVNKPVGWTSFDVVNKVRNHIRTLLGMKNIRIGHAGTLDPLAEGLLILCTGKFTKRIEEFQAFEKEYTGTFFIGMTTPCDDLEKEPDTSYPTAHITEELLLQTASGFVGEQEQYPPVFSAIKVEGKRLYKYARKHREVEIRPRTIFISEFELTNTSLPHVDFRVVCSKGTYIRALARDFGRALGSGAYLEKLCRTRIGEYRLEQAVGMGSFSGRNTDHD